MSKEGSCLLGWPQNGDHGLIRRSCYADGICLKRTTCKLHRVDREFTFYWTGRHSMFFNGSSPQKLDAV